MKHKCQTLIQPLSNQRGVSLVEVIVVMGIVVIMIMISGGGVGLFFRKYSELKAYAQLQEDALEAINYIKSGIPVGSSEVRQMRNGDFQFIKAQEYYGVNNAVELRFLQAPPGAMQSSAIRVIPMETENVISPSDYADFTVVNGALKCKWRYKGISYPNTLDLFPKSGKKDIMFLDQLTFKKLNADSDVKAIEVSLKASVKIAPKQFKRVHFRAKMAKNVRT